MLRTKVRNISYKFPLKVFIPGPEYFQKITLECYEADSYSQYLQNPGCKHFVSIMHDDPFFAFKPDDGSLVPWLITPHDNAISAFKIYSDTSIANDCGETCKKFKIFYHSKTLDDPTRIFLQTATDPF